MPHNYFVEHMVGKGEEQRGRGSPHSPAGRGLGGGSTAGTRGARGTGGGFCSRPVVLVPRSRSASGARGREAGESSRGDSLALSCSGVVVAPGPGSASAIRSPHAHHSLVPRLYKG
uniref:Uncharacterized protein n=1 Tax=Arundo donax TaxID=35708 RepID=A0A0A9CXW3_ARUDO